MTLVRSDQLDTSPPRFVVAGMLPEVGAGLFHGPSYAGKSLVADVELALCIVNGTPFFGHATARGPVVLCLGEGLYDAGCRKQARLARQARDNALAVTDVARVHGSEAAAALAAALPPMTDDGLYVITEPFTVPLSRGGELTPGLKAAIASVRAVCPEPALVLLDSLADFTGGLSLSNDSSANRLMLGLKAMSRELETCVLAVCHNGKEGTPGAQHLLGAQRLYNASDMCISVTPDDVSSPGADKTATIACEKSKYGPEFEPIGYRVEACEWDQPAEDDDGNQVPGETVTIRSATVRMLETARPGRAPEPRRPAAPLPEIRDVERPRKRSGIRPDRGGLRVVPDPAAARKTMVAGILSVRCDTCSRPNACGCDLRMERGSIVPLSMSPPLGAHESRILDAALAGAVDLDEVIALVA